MAPENWKSAAPKVKQWWTFLILVQISLMYFLESFLKISTGWLNDNGLAIALQEKELVTTAGSWLAQQPTATNFLGLAAILISILILIASVANIFFRQQKLLAALGIIYHLGAAMLLRLDWLPAASILPFLLFIQIGDKENTSNSFLKDIPDKNNFILAGFLIYGILATPFWLQLKNPNLFFKLPFQQTWAGYAPPSSYSGIYTTTLSEENKNHQSWYGGELITGVRKISDLRVYKLYHNMLRQGSYVLRSAYLDYVCLNKMTNNPSVFSSAELIADWVTFYPGPARTGHSILLKKQCLNK
ncbi:MAG: hypothetical protein H7328_09565 [Bdellovibrio sp.]|nr:hypothetical protein [Bdellovibrio sp.]